MNSRTLRCTLRHDDLPRVRLGRRSGVVPAHTETLQGDALARLPDSSRSQSMNNERSPVLRGALYSDIAVATWA